MKSSAADIVLPAWVLPPRPNEPSDSRLYQAELGQRIPRACVRSDERKRRIAYDRPMSGGRPHFATIWQRHWSGGWLISLESTFFDRITGVECGAIPIARGRHDGFEELIGRIGPIRRIGRIESGPRGTACEGRCWRAVGFGRPEAESSPFARRKWGTPLNWAGCTG